MAKNASGPDRLGKYSDRLFYTGSLAIPKVVLDQKIRMLDLETTHFNNMVQFETATKTVLDEEGIDTMQYVGYLNFSRRCYALTQKFSGPTLINAVNIALTVFVARGFVQAILERIRDEVWTLPAPTP
jgi:hypothetical protein